MKTHAKRAIPSILLAMVLPAVRSPAADPAPEEEAYWWQDELRTVAFELSEARSGKVSAWPQMTVRAGAGDLPLPPSKGPITVDGRIDEPAWERATSFPVGPIFGAWREGPFELEVRALRDAASLHLAIESPRDLAGLGSLSDDGELFSIGGRGYKVDENGGFAGGAIGSKDAARILELSIPLPEGGKAVSLSFPVEIVRRRDGRLPPGFVSLGIAKLAAAGGRSARKETIWLDPIEIRLVPAEAAEKGFRHEGFRYLEPTDEARRARYVRERAERAAARRRLLEFPLLFVKRHPYFAGHIYDDYYTWHPGGGIYVYENPSEAYPRRVLRPVIDAKTEPTLGAGIYRDPHPSWDAKRIVFAYKPAPDAMTSVYEIGVDGRGLRRLTESDRYHDINPCYLPDGRIVFKSTRPRGRVPCFNSGVDTLHTMDADGGKIASISSNNVNEFDPSILPDGRILYGRWEYVDKTALYMQSLWTIFPDGTNETALFGNNLAMPTAFLDAMGVPGTQMVVASLTPHNGQAVGAIGMIDPARGKNNLRAIFNFTPEYPVEMDQGLAIGPCDPYPLSKDELLISNNALGGHGIIELIDRAGRRDLILCDPEVSCYGPLPLRSRPAPPVLASLRAAGDGPGRFLVLDVNQGLRGIERGEVKRLRVIEETARTSEVPPGGRWWNQAFLMSWQGAYVVKCFLGTVPVLPDGSAYFEAPPGRALYLEALDADGREIQRMRTFVQAVPGVTRSCIGCHEDKRTAPLNAARSAEAAKHPPARIEPESWGSGFIDYPTMIQPILDARCVRCHGGEEDIAAGIDLSGGWTWAFNISYETLLKENLVGFIRCNNADTTSSDILPPRTIGSGAAPFGDLLVEGHGGRIPDLTRAERDLLMAWMDGNSNYYGTWDYTEYATCDAILACGAELAGAMQAAGCTRCHAAGHIGNDWVNLRTPERSRILRAPLAPSAGGLGLAWCRERKSQQGLPLVTQAHLPPDVFRPPAWPKRDPTGDPCASFASTGDAHYQAFLAIIRRARDAALARPRVDMPGASIVTGVCRMQAPVPIPDPLPSLAARILDDGMVELSWPRTADLIGLEFELYRGRESGFAPDDRTRIADTTGFLYTDPAAPAGDQHYALVLRSGEMHSSPIRASAVVPPPAPPPPPASLAARSLPGQVVLTWSAPASDSLRYVVYRAAAGSVDFVKITHEPVAGATYTDSDAVSGVEHAYVVRSISRRGMESEASPPVKGAALPETKEPVFAVAVDGAIDLGAVGHVSFPHRPEFDLGRRFSIACWIRFDRMTQMPVVLSCGHWQGTGWFLQSFGGRWRWHVGGVDCDGGATAAGRWIHVVATFDGDRARVFQDGVRVAEVPCRPNPTPWPGPLFIGQYGPSPGPSYQVEGRIAGVKIFQRSIGEKEAKAMFDERSR